jgi:hypothetical protein
MTHRWIAEEVVLTIGRVGHLLDATISREGAIPERVYGMV